MNLKELLNGLVNRYCTVNYRYATIEIEFIPRKFSGDEHQARDYALKWGRDLHKLCGVEDDFITVSLMGPPGAIEDILFPVRALTFKIPNN